MSEVTNSVQNLIGSFKNVCQNLEDKGERDLELIENECAEEFNAAAKTINDFDHLIAGISETHSELLNSNEILKTAVNRAIEKNVIQMPFDIQSSTVKCINDIYNIKTFERKHNEQRLIDEKKLELFDELLKKI